MNDLYARLEAVGIGPAVIERMLPLQANVLDSNNLLLRVCEHGIKHPVGHLDRPLRVGQFPDPHRSGAPLESAAQCDGCCADWPKGLTIDHI